MRRNSHDIATPASGSARFAAAALLLAAGAACTEAPAGTDYAPAPADPVVEVLWSPAEGVLPFPDALFLDARSHGVLPPDASPGDVRGALLRFVALNEGAPADTPAALEFSAAVDADSLAGGVALLREDGSRVDAAVSATLGGRGALVVPAAPLVAGARYVLVALGGSTGLRGAAGAPVVRSASFAFAAGDDVAVEDLPGARATADKLDRIQGIVGDNLDVAVAGGFDRDAVLVASSFTVSGAPRVVLDVQQRSGPWPSDFARDADGRTTLPPADLDGMLDPAERAVAEEAAGSVRGFSTSARVRVPLSGRADGTAGFSLYALDDPAGPAAVDGVDVTLSADASTVFLHKSPALRPARRYAVVVTADARAGGREVAPSLDAALLVAAAPLAVDGRAVTAVLSDDHARALEGARAELQPLVDAVGRDRVRMAVPFSTLDAFAFVDAAARMAADVSPAVHDVVVQSPWDRGLYAVIPHVDTVVSGTYSSLDFIDPVTLRAGAPRTGEVPFILTVPPAPADGGPIPVVVFGHGLITAKELAYLIADQLAQAGFATFAIDLPMHGERTVCLVDAHCALFQTCGADHQCKDSHGAPGSLAEGDSPWEGGPHIPLATGEAFVLVDDLVASRDHFLQGMVDLRQGLRLLGAGGLDGVAGDDVFAHDHFGWLGISLGGIFGAAMSGSTTAIDDFVLNVPGADLVVTLEDSTVLSPLLDAELNKRNIARGSDAFADFEDVAHLLLDPVDPLNLAPRATVDCPADWQHKRVILQMADTDLVVPNAATRALSAAMHVGISEYHPLVSNHGFLLDPTSLEGSAARDQAVRFLQQ